MAYRPFFEIEAEDAPATFANPATFRAEKTGSVADLADVAAPTSKTDFATPLDRTPPEPHLIAKPMAPEGLTLEDQIAAFEERAGILEYDEGLPREEAERLAREQTRHLLH
ncbi:hypothetical protein [Bosea sp. NBC_00550]|uniref:hypothetical protein n=1 Tax=Bosea sp. NBC_00550 TaxID=2969621 RepID=UPI0022301481|nr:hypothetical protein [Bosea sp. NBC_00550]UZF91644.1 hypothetical protein NWE53_21425 [Bosea sp. NBC_00550]